MEKKPGSIKRNSHVKDILEHLWSDLKVEKFKKPKVDVPTPPDFSAALRIRKENIFWKYKGEADSDDYWKNLGFGNGVPRRLCVRNNVLFSPDALQMLARSWFKEAMTEEEQCASKYMPKKEKKEDDADRVYAKELLHQFLKQAEARKRIGGKKIRSTSAPCRGN